MNHALVIARRELRDRSRLFLLAAALAFIPFIASLMPGARGNRSDIIAMGGSILGVALGVGVAVTLGNTTIGRELSERRLSFYFAKPLTPAALWIGKAGAALTASMVCFLIVALPALLAVRRSWTAGFVDAPAILVAGAVAIFVLFFVSHSISTIVRSRSSLVALDLTLLAIAAGAVYLIVRPIAFAGAIDHTLMMLSALATLLLFVLVVAPVWQLANGRTDARRSHAAFSRAVWPAVAVIVVLAGAVGAWLLSVDPSDLTAVQHVMQAPAGDWMLISGEGGTRANFPASFVVNRATGKWERLPSFWWWRSYLSADGRAVASPRPEGLLRWHRARISVRMLAKGRTYDTGVTATGDRFVLSDDSSRLAVVNGNLLSVHDVVTGRVVASAAGFDPQQNHYLFFPSPDVVRVIEWGRERMRILELDTATRKLVQTGAPDRATPPIGASADGSRLMFADGIGDGRTGALLAELPPRDAGSMHTRLLHDGSIARTRLLGDSVSVQTFAPDGSARHETVLPGMKRAYIAGSTKDGRLIVPGNDAPGVRRWHSSSHAPKQEWPAVFVIDLATGAIEQVRENLRGPYPAWSPDPRVRPLGDELTSIDSEGRVVLWKHGGRAEARPLLSSR